MPEREARVYLWAQQSVREVAALRQHQQHNSPVMIVEEFKGALICQASADIVCVLDTFRN